MGNLNLALFSPAELYDQQSLQGLIEIYQSSIKENQCKVVVVNGAEGVGKTVLARAFLNWVEKRGAVSFYGRTFAANQYLPYHPLLEIIHTWISQPEVEHKIPHIPCLNELSHVLPDLKIRFPSLSNDSLNEELAESGLSRAVAYMGTLIAQQQPVVLFIDDIQWADPATLNFLLLAIHEWMVTSTPLLLLLSVRKESLVGMSSLVSWLTTLYQRFQALTVDLGALTQRKTVELVNTLSSKTTTLRPEQLEIIGYWLSCETSGNPLHITELLEVLLRRGMLNLSWKEAGEGRFNFDTLPQQTKRLLDVQPPGLHSVLLARLAGLSTDAYALLEAGSILACPFSANQLYTVAHLRERDRGAAALADLQEQHLLEQVDDTTFYFTHERVRLILYYAQMSKERRLDLHGRAFALLQEERASPALLLYHAVAMGMQEQAFYQGIEAGDSALFQFAPHVAIACYEQAEKVLEELLRSPLSVFKQHNLAISSIERLHLQLGHAYTLAHMTQKTDMLYRIMAARANKLKAREMEFNALNCIAQLMMDEQRDYEGAAQLLKQTLQLASSNPDHYDESHTSILIDTEMHLARLNSQRFDAPSALLHGQRALKLAREQKNIKAIADSLHVLVKAELLSGLWEQAEAHAWEARQLYEQLHNQEMEIDCLRQIAKVCIHNGQPGRGATIAHDAYVLSQKLMQRKEQALCLYDLVTGLLEIGEYNQALIYARSFTTFAENYPEPELRGMALTILGQVYRALLSLDAACKLHQEALNYYRTNTSPSYLDLGHNDLCLDYAQARNWPTAHEHLIQAMKQTESPLFLYTNLTFWQQIEVLVRVGNIRLAEEQFARFSEQADQNCRYRISYLRAQAALAQGRKKINEAISALQEALSLAEEIGLPGELWSIEARLGGLYIASGNREKAQIGFAHVIEIIQKLASSIEDEQLRTQFLSAQQVGYILQKRF
jgi:predicted ATPase